MIGIVALVAEFGLGLLIKTQNQRVADLAAFAGASAYNSTSSASTMSGVISNVAALNGYAAGSVSGSIVTSPTGSGSQAVSVSVLTNKLLLLAPVVGSSNSLSVNASSIAEMNAQAAPCIIALSGASSGVTLSGGTSVSAPACAVASNAAVSVPCGTTITTKAVTYNSASAPSQPCSGIQPPTGTASVKYTRTSTSDPLASNSGVTSATARISTVASMSAPSAPTVTAGGDIDFAWSASSTQSQAVAVGCTAAFASSTWTLTCPAGATITFGNITLGGGITVNFNTGGSSTNTYKFSGMINNTGTALNFGPGTYTIAKGIMTGGGSTTTFGAGTFNIGSATSSCNGSGTYSICNLGTSLTFGGPSTFTLSAGIYNTGGSSLTMGSGTTNSFQIGPSSTGNALYMGGGANTTFADATGGSSVFKLVGNLNVAAGGGSCLKISAAAQHDIKGFFATAGGTTLGAGIYTVNGYVGLGANGGGDVTCGGSTVGVSASNVTLVISGTTTPGSGTCSGQAFCVASGYGHVTLTAPTTGSNANLAVIGPTSSSNTAGALFTEGASGTSLSGAFYFPYGPVSMSGGASVGNGSGQCLELIGSQVTLAGGSALASLCVGASSTAAAVVLVQ